MRTYLLLTVLLICSFFAGKSQNNDPIILIFPPLDAKITNNQLNVEWTVPTEDHVKHYEIEISKNGTTFSKIGTVLSKTEDGNSTTPISYTFSRPTTGLVAGALLFLLPLLGFSINKAKQNRTKYIHILATLFISVVALVSCRKSDVGGDKTEALYLRIAQINKADHALYSKTVKVQ